MRFIDVVEAMFIAIGGYVVVWALLKIFDK